MNHEKRNLALFFTDSVLFTNAMTFLSVNAVITYFLATLGASTLQIGLANAIVSIGAFVSQPIYAKQVMNLTFKLGTFVKVLLTQRIFFLLFVCSIPLLAESHPQLMVYLFLLCWAIFSWFIGAYSPFYMSAFAKMIAVHHRGRLRGYSGAMGNFLALGSALITGWMLKGIPYPYNYTLIFAVGVLLLIADALVFAFMKEEPDQVHPIRTNYFQYFMAIPGIFRNNKPFMKIVIGFTFMMISQFTLAYYALYAVREFSAGASEIALFAAITGIVNVIGSIAFGILADRYGHRLVLILASLAGAIAGFLVVLAPQLFVVFIAFALTNLCMSGYNISSGVLIIETVSREQLPMYVSVNTMVTLVVSAIVTVGGSFLVDLFSFASVFVIAGAAGIFGCFALYNHAGRSKLAEENVHVVK